MGTLSAGFDVAAGTGQAFGQFGAGRAQRAISNAQAKQFQRDADTAIRFGQVERQRELRKGSRAVASQRALFAARGIDPDIASAAAVTDDIAGASLFNQLVNSNQALARAINLRGQAAISKFQGKFARDKALVDANVTLLRTTAQATRSFGL